jgi:hypothetical protein
MNFSVLPPEINSFRIFAGAGSAPMLEAAAAWDGLAAELATAASSFESVTSGLVNGAWQGAASQAMTAAAAPYSGWLSAVTTQAEQAATQARTMAGAFESVLSAVVHPALVDANRMSLLSLVQTNLFGFNAPAIASAEAVYEEMWAVDVGAMFDYYGQAAAAVSTLTPFAAPLQGLSGVVSQLAGGGQAAAAAIPAATAPTFDFLAGALTITVGQNSILVRISTPGITLPSIHIPPVNLSAFSLPQISIPPINIPAGQTPANIVVGAFNLPQITTPNISVPPINLPAVTIPGFNLPQISVPGFGLPEITVPGFGLPEISVPGITLPTIGVPRIFIPRIQFPDLLVRETIKH